MPGDLKLSVYPWLALNLGPASIGNPRGFGDAPFATLQHAAVRVKLLPLLRKELEVGRIEIDGLDVRLVQNEDGKGNWRTARPRCDASGTIPTKPRAGQPRPRRRRHHQRSRRF
ncbi:MAG: AsmA family protein [Proteobacteria bacterium]|nr:AsmA family protein [Pseudomonadota bacterium]